MRLGDAKVGQWGVMLDLDASYFLCEITVIAAFTVANQGEKHDFPWVLVFIVGLASGVIAAMPMVVPFWLLSRSGLIWATVTS